MNGIDMDKMKNINQIFRDNTYLLDEIEVMELIEYTKELEGKVMENNLSKQFSFEDKLTEVVRDIYTSVNQVIDDEKAAVRFGEIEHVDFEKCVENLKDYIQKFSADNNFRL